MIATALLAAAFAVSAPGPAGEFAELPFAFSLDQIAEERFHNPPEAQQPIAVPGAVTLDLGDATGRWRVDVFERSSSSLPAWKWSRSAVGSGRRAAFGGRPGVEALVVVRRHGSSHYRLYGPFSWPEEATRYTIPTAESRTVAGKLNRPASDLRFHLVGANASAEALCETDGKGVFQCIGVPAAFSGIVAACSAGSLLAFGEAGPASTLSFQQSTWACAIHVISKEAPQSGGVEVKLQKPGPARGQIWEADPSLATRNLGGDFFWLWGSTPVSEQVLVVRGPAQSSARVELASLIASVQCGEPADVTLEQSQRLFGTVSDSENHLLASPFILVFEDPSPGNRAPRLLTSVEGDENGRFEVGELGARTYLVRACHPSLGCMEERAAAGPNPIEFHLRGRGIYRGRIVSSGGVPEPRATVRVLPTLEGYGRAPNPMQLIMPETRSADDGRFQIAVPSTGSFILEALGQETGTARRTLDVSEFTGPTDLGDIQLGSLIEFWADVGGCNGGTLVFIGPVLGPTSLPNRLNFPVEQGRALVRLTDGGNWLASAMCLAVRRSIDPMLLQNVEQLAGQTVRFRLVEETPTPPRP